METSRLSGEAPPERHAIKLLGVNIAEGERERREDAVGLAASMALSLLVLGELNGEDDLRRGEGPPDFHEPLLRGDMALRGDMPLHAFRGVIEARVATERGEEPSLPPSPLNICLAFSKLWHSCRPSGVSKVPARSRMACARQNAFNASTYCPHLCVVLPILWKSVAHAFVSPFPCASRIAEAFS